MKTKNRPYKLQNFLAMVRALVFSLSISMVGVVYAQNKGGDVGAGKRTYQKRCMPCHGKEGKGDGPASWYIEPRPRDFTVGLYKLVSSEDGSVPLDEDIFNAITKGMPGTSMPAWDGILTPDERWQLVNYVKTFSDKFAKKKPNPLKMGKGVSPSKESIEEGKKLFSDNCERCHGINGKGNGEEAMRKYKEGKFNDFWGNPILPRNLTAGWQFRGGYKPEDIFKRISIGIPGTPMPSFEDVSEEERWHIVNYVNSLVREEKTTGEVILKGVFVKGDLPLDPSSSVWNSRAGLQIPLNGQIMVYPRLINPSVDMVTVKVIFNEKDIAFLLEWDDRTKSVVHNPSGPLLTPKDEHKTTYPVRYPPETRKKDQLRDEAVIQFPVKMPEGPSKPFFFWGNSGNPVNLWSFKADWQEDSAKKSPVEELNAAGYMPFPTPQPEKSQQVLGKGIYHEGGYWQVVMKRSLLSEDTANDVVFEKGKFVPFSIQIMDGSNGEAGLQRSISSWYYVFLEAPTPVMAYWKGIIGLVLAIGLEFILIKKARKSDQV